MAEENAPNQGATGEAPADAAPAAQGDGPPPADPGPAAAGPVNQGATGTPPPWSEAARGTSEAPLEAESGGDTFSERPELYVGAAFVGGFALAMILKRVGR